MEGSLAVQPFVDDAGAVKLLFPRQPAPPISITPDTVQQILAYAAEREQTLTDLRNRIAELEHLVQTDELTGLLNRRGFETAAGRALANAARYGETGVLALIDLDGFKRVNDDWGHAAGDAALRLIGKILTDHIRTTDYAARLSGDEFALLCVRANPTALARRIRQLKRTLDCAVLPWDGKHIALRASVGSAAYDATTTLENLQQRADKAMYRQKRARR